MISEGSCDDDAVMMLKIQLCITEINYILKHTKIEKKVILNCNNISQYYGFIKIFKTILLFYYIFVINAALSSIRYFFQKQKN